MPMIHFMLPLLSAMTPSPAKTAKAIATKKLFILNFLFCFLSHWFLDGNLKGFDNDWSCCLLIYYPFYFLSVDSWFKDKVSLDNSFVNIVLNVQCKFFAFHKVKIYLQQFLIPPKRTKQILFWNILMLRYFSIRTHNDTLN